MKCQLRLMSYGISIISIHLGPHTCVFVTQKYIFALPMDYNHIIIKLTILIVCFLTGFLFLWKNSGLAVWPEV